MKEETKAELDLLFRRKYKISQERRKSPDMTLFETHQSHLDRFDSVQQQVIRPAMEHFGRYLESVGHGYFIAFGRELLDGHLHPTSKITLHILLNSHLEKQVRQTPSLTFRTDETHTVHLFARGTAPASCAPVGHYELSSITGEVVESHLKTFVIQTVLQD